MAVHTNNKQAQTPRYPASYRKSTYEKQSVSEWTDECSRSTPSILRSRPLLPLPATHSAALSCSSGLHRNSCTANGSCLLLLCRLRSSSKLPLLFFRPLTTGCSSSLSSVRPCLLRGFFFLPPRLSHGHFLQLISP